MKVTLPATVGELRPDPRNPRTISESAAQGLAFSMEEFGDISGIVFNVRTNNLVSGHQRRDRLPPGAAIDFTPQKDENGTVGYGAVMHEGARWIIRFVDWPEEKETAANLAANNAAIQGEFTSDVEALLTEIRTGSPDIFDQLLMHTIEIPDGERERSGRGAAETDGGGDPKYRIQAELYESYNYVVLFFRNELDWNIAREHFGIESTRKAAQRGKIGVGRVLDGAAYMRTERPQ